MNRISSIVFNRIWPGLRTAGRDEQRRGIGLILSAVYCWILLLLTLIWLLSISDISELRGQWLPAIILVILRVVSGQLDLSSFVLSSEAYSRGSVGRLVTWSAVLIFGPVALWLDVAAMLVDALEAWRDRSDTETNWRLFGQIPMVSLRDTLPTLVTISLLFPSIPQSLVGQQTVIFSPELFWATFVKTAFSVILLSPLFAFDLLFISHISGLLTGLLTLVRSLRFGLGSFAALGLPDWVGLLSAGLYIPGQPWIYLIALSAITIVAVFVHFLNQQGVRGRQLLSDKELLEELNRDLLLEGPAEQDYTSILARYIPKLFPESQVEIAASDGGVLFSEDGSLQLLAADVVDQTQNSGRSFLRLHFELNPDRIREGIVVPITSPDDQHVYGAIALVPSQTRNNRSDFLQLLFSLSQLLAAFFRQSELIEEALDSQAEAFQEELFAQAYEAEMTIAYEQISRELALAGQIQNSFLPESIPDIPGWEITVSLEPAHETSGDYYDIIELPEGLLGLLIADVTDKGIGASLYMALSRTLIRTFAKEYFREPARVLEAANQRILQDSKADLFVTVCYLVLDPETGQLIYCNAGHNPPLLWRGESPDDPERLTRTALPLGIFEDEEWEQTMIQMEPGDLLTLYTDGITEAQDEDEDFFGEERLIKVISANVEKSAQIVEDKVLSALANFTGDAPQSDDITLMLLRRE